MIEFDYEDEKTIVLTQEFVGDDVDVQIRNESGDVDYDFTIHKDDFIKMLDKYQRRNYII